MTQLEITFADPRLDASEKARLSRQCQAIIERLHQGSATNKELSRIALKYTSRISDLRKSGYKIRAERYEGGLVVYELSEP